jgi:hypothetical protein
VEKAVIFIGIFTSHLMLNSNVYIYKKTTMVAVYLHEEILETSRPAGEIQFMGKSQPFYAKIRTALLTAIPVYPQVPLKMRY